MAAQKLCNYFVTHAVHYLHAKIFKLQKKKQKKNNNVIEGHLKQYVAKIITVVSMWRFLCLVQCMYWLSVNDN